MQYACFISYCHGQYDLMKRFIEQLKKALKDYLDPYLDEEVYIDTERLQPGFEYNEALANAICHSICMIVIYTPKYERHPYCLREYTAMEIIEKNRLRLLGDKAEPGLRMIIPIIFRGMEDLPPKIKDCRNYCDFSGFTLATQDIGSNPKFIEHIEKIAECIYKHYKTLKTLDDKVYGKCNEFKLPSVEKIQSLRDDPKKQKEFSRV